MNWDYESIVKEINKLLGMEEEDGLKVIAETEKDEYCYTSIVDHDKGLYIAHNRESFFVPVVANIMRDYIQKETVWPSAALDGTELPHAHIIYRDMCRAVMAHYEECSHLNFSTINRLSSMSYEKDSLKTKLTFIPTDLASFNLSDSDLGIFIKFKTPQKFPLDIPNLKQICKLCAGLKDEDKKESSNNSDDLKDEDKLLFSYKNECDKYYCCGYTKGRAFPYTIDINGVYDWAFCIEDYPIFRVVHDELKALNDEAERAISALESEFGSIEDTSGIRTEIRKKINAIQQQKHGASIIFLDFNDEVSSNTLERLARYERSIEITPQSISGINEKELKEIARIDGAIIVNIKNWEITHLATILDGVALSKGSLDRGARHNSINTFLTFLTFLKSKVKGESGDHKVKGVALIFSEDGGMRVIKASEIEIPPRSDV